MKKNTIFAIVAVIIVVAAAAVLLYTKMANSITAGNGIYYSQKNSGYYVQFKKDKTFVIAYNPEKDAAAESGAGQNEKVEAYIENSGTWKMTGNTITMKYDNDKEDSVLIKTKDGLYNPNNIYKGIPPKDKIIKATYTYQPEENRYYSLIFFDDLTMTCDAHWDGKVKTRPGRYTRTDDIVTVRYNDNADYAHKFLVINEGLADDIYTK